MHITGMLMSATDCAPGREVDYARWLDEVVRPETCALDGVVDLRCYCAGDELQALRGANPLPAFAPGRSAFLDLAVFGGGDLEHAARTVRDRRVALAASAPCAIEQRHTEAFELRWALGEEGLALSDDAVPFARHDGVQVAFGEVSDEAMRPVIADWYRTIHAPDALEVPGFVAALRLVSIENVARHLVMFLLSGAPLDAVRAVHARVPAWREQGRTPSPGGASRAIFNGPFAMIGARSTASLPA